MKFRQMSKAIKGILPILFSMPSFMRKIPFVYPQRLNCMWAEKHFPENWKGIVSFQNWRID